MPDVPRPAQELLGRLAWFIQLRWLFVAGLGVAVLSGAYLFRLDFPVGKAAAVGAVVFAYNVLFLLYHRRLSRRPVPDLTTSRMEAGLQIGLDLLALTALVHLTGGAENPFICFYLIHAIAGSMLLSKRDAWLVGLAAFSLFVLTVGLEYASVLPHYHSTGVPDGARHQNGAHLVAVSAGFLVTLFSTITITSSIMNGLRTRERQLVHTQAALLRKSEDLEAAYAAVTEKQTQLIQAEKQASLGQLVAGVAHEINNPIQFIRGNMAILSEAFSDVLPLLDEQSASRGDLRIARLDYPFFRKQLPVLLKDMEDGATRIGAIVRDLKTFARRDEGRLDEGVDLNELVEATVRLFHNKLKHFRVEEDLAPNLPKLCGNLTQLQQVLVNTLQNATEALGRDAKGRIRVRTAAEQGGERVRLSIEDNGPGIAPEVLDHIFDPFFTTKQRSGGTGLGLAITYGIIQQHHGQILVDSHVGDGTAFHFLLPVKRNGAACAS